MARAHAAFRFVLATFASVLPPPAWACMVSGSFWHLPASSQAGGYLALDGAVVTLLRVDTQEVVDQRITDAGGEWSFEVDVPAEFVVAVSGFATLGGPGGDLYFFGDPPRGNGDGSPVGRCADRSIEFGPLHALQGTAAPSTPLHPRPRVAARPPRARSGARFMLKVRHFDSGERLLAVEERSDGTARAGTLDTDPRGVGRMSVVGPQLVGRHRWCFRGETSHQEACATYRVRRP